MEENKPLCMKTSASDVRRTSDKEEGERNVGEEWKSGEIWMKIVDRWCLLL